MSPNRVTRVTAVLTFIFVLGLGVPLLHPAWAQQSVTLNAGYFAVRGADTRIDQDVLLENLNLFSFDLSDFNNANVGGEWNVALGEYFETSVGLGFYQRTVPSVYDDFVDLDGTEITQDFRLRVVPFSATVRVLPFGQGASFQPYFGGGLGVYNWRYSEVGEFIDFTDFSVFRDRYVANGTDLGGIILGGVRVPVSDRYAIGAEVRYHEVNGFVGIDQGFLEDRIDLGGLATQFTFQVKF